MKLYKRDVTKAVKKTAKEIRGHDIWNMLIDKGINRLRPKFLDKKFKVLDLPTVKKFLAWDKTDKLKYIPEFRDCEDFAKIVSAHASEHFAVNSFGVVIDLSGKHAYNLVPYHTKRGLNVLVFEPQTDQPIKRFTKQYAMNCGELRF